MVANHFYDDFKNKPGLISKEKEVYALYKPNTS
jgi:hypothetical protein